jgi:ferredoxin--NADP+ reductase
MNAIIAKQQLSADVWRMVIASPDIARERRPGQFVIVQVDLDYGERIPLTIADADPAAGTITLIFQAVGKSTRLLAAHGAGDRIAAVLGPLGTPTHIEKFGTVVCVGGGIGCAPLYPIAQAMKRAGNRLVVIQGARNAGLVILQDEFRAIADELILCTDDGSAGRKALVTEPLKELCAGPARPDLAVAIGPPAMMRFCAEATRPFAVPTVVSLNTIMIDGTGMCGGCRVKVGDETRFVCVDGPEFDGHLVDFQTMQTRLGSYKAHEEAARRDHDCRIGL